ncbi:acyl-CoA dehydrogenase [Paraferrimonas sp. SM1919]|uniref:acyl-CoA dehydrogenase n=1 Tax=Paraferrimonas sp. SM1919 TaxID=2662263 RepID=UPI0013D78512|nr:acyl-CoA dehydrogenase [Paraferrimonas sp. SM1919]
MLDLVLFILTVTIAVIAIVLAVPGFRKQLLSKPAFAYFKRVLPPLSITEREAMEAGEVWWEGELFAGSPDWNKLHAYPANKLTEEEQHFIDNQLQTALKMIDDHDFVQNRKDLSPELWQYLKDEGFFALIIPKKYGGREFSSYANSTIVSQITARSYSVGVTVMVPNSLGPGELLSHYGTQEQRDYWLPRLADGREIPCFALTGPEAGSDAGGIPDTGVVCKGEHEGKEVLGLRLNWDKRYITLGPIATVLGLAFKMRDPDGLLGDKKELGITCALIPTDHPGVIKSTRHNPLNMAFMNGTTRGKDVFIPLDWIIGGVDYAGRGWRMLVECLSAGRGISLPALATSTSHMALKTTTAYGNVRKQFGVSLTQFEGVEEALARMVANTYLLEASRRLTLGALDAGVKPSVVTAMTKYHMTELGRKVLDDAMDIQAGKGIQLGPKNYLGHHYMGVPVSITVEGANILTRSLMIFGQGATRCHPYVLGEMEAAAMEDQNAGLDKFDKLLVKHIGYATTNAFKSFFSAITASAFNSSPVAGETKGYYKQMGRISASLAIVTDISMLVLGGDLKRKEMFSARLGDVLSELYLASAALKWFEENGHTQEELPVVHYIMQNRLYNASKALEGAIRNFPSTIARGLLKLLVFPFGNHFKVPSDALAQDVARSVAGNTIVRQRLTQLCPDLEGDTSGIAEVETAYQAQLATAAIQKKLAKAQRSGKLPRKVAIPVLVDKALEQELIDNDEASQLLEFEELRKAAMAVNDFAELPVVNTAAKATKKTTTKKAAAKKDDETEVA